VSVTVRVVVMLLMMMMMKVVVSSRRRRRRIDGRSVGMAKRKLEEIPYLRFGVRFGISYSHDLFVSL
jgi:hypothetical protein